jgi:hypothetical protein
MRRMLFVCVMCWLLIVGGAGNPRAMAQDTDCADLPPTRLDGARYGRVLPGPVNNLRAEPSTSADLVSTLQSGEFFIVIDEDATCADGHVWRKVQTFAKRHLESMVGWTVETIEDDYALEPLTETQSEFITLYTPSSITVGAGELVPAEIYRPDGQALPPFYEVPLTIAGQTRGGTVRVFDDLTVLGYPTWLGHRGNMFSLLSTLLHYPETFESYLATSDNQMPRWEIGRGETQLLWARLLAIETEGGTSGVRFITQYSASIEPTAITRDSLIYHFIGADALGVFSFSMPLTVQMLPATAAEDAAFQAVGTDPEAYATYLAQVKQTLENSDVLTDAGLELQLSTYDDMVRLWVAGERAQLLLSNLPPSDLPADHPATLLPTTGCTTQLAQGYYYTVRSGTPALALRNPTDAPTDFVWQARRDQAVYTVDGPFCVADNTYWLMVNADGQMGYLAETRDNGGSVFTDYSGNGPYPDISERYDYLSRTVCRLYTPDGSVRVYADPNADGRGFALFAAARYYAAGLVRNAAGDWWYLPRGASVPLGDEREMVLQSSVWVNAADVIASDGEGAP